MTHRSIHGLLPAIYVSLLLLGSTVECRQHSSTHSGPFQSRPYVEHYSRAHHSSRSSSSSSHDAAEFSQEKEDFKHSDRPSEHEGREYLFCQLEAFCCMMTNAMHSKLGAMMLECDSARSNFMAMILSDDLQVALKSTSPTAGARKPGLASTLSSLAPGRTAAKRASRASTMPLRNAQTMGTTLTAGDPTKVQRLNALTSKVPLTC